MVQLVHSILIKLNLITLYNNKIPCLFCYNDSTSGAIVCVFNKSTISVMMMHENGNRALCHYPKIYQCV